MNHAATSFGRRLLWGGASLPLLALLAAALMAIPTPSLQAQSPVIGAGWSAGASYVTELNSNASASARSLEPGAGYVTGIFADRWIGQDRRFGIRTQLSYQQPRFDWLEDERKIDTGALDVVVLVRPTLPDSNASVLPYLALGAGAIWYDLGSGRQTTFQPSESFYDGRSRLLPTGVVALGVDFPTRFKWTQLPVTVRVEAADHVTFQSPLKDTTDGSRHGPVHHFRFTIGLLSTLRWH